MQDNQKIRINNYIRVPQVRLISNDGYSVGVISTRDALKMAQEQCLDLVEINPKAIPPVCKILDFGKFKYEEKKKQAEIKKNQKISETKELSFRSNIDDNDLNHKLEQAKQFLLDGDKVKFTIKFRGREIAHAKLGKEKLEWILSQLNSVIMSNPQISLEGKIMSMLVVPTKTNNNKS